MNLACWLNLCEYGALLRFIQKRRFQELLCSIIYRCTFNEVLYALVKFQLDCWKLKKLSACVCLVLFAWNLKFKSRPLPVKKLYWSYLIGGYSQYLTQNIYRYFFCYFVGLAQ